MTLAHFAIGILYLKTALFVGVLVALVGCSLADRWRAYRARRGSR